MLSTNQPKGLHFTSLELKLVFSDPKPLKNFFEGGMSIAKLDRIGQEFNISLEFIQGKLNKVTDVILRLKNEGLYIEHSDEKPTKVKVSQEDRIEEILDKVTNPSNFEKVLNMNKAFSIKKLLHSQMRDKFCRRLARLLHKQSDFRINHEGLLVKQISILRNIYQVYVVPQRLVPRIIKIFHDNRGHQGISRTVNMMKGRFWFRRMQEQVNRHVSSCLICCQHATHKVKYESKHLPIPQRPFDGICLDCVGPLERSSRGFKWILTYIDLHSSFLLALPMKSKSADAIIHSYVESILSSIGPSKYILTDNGTEF